MVLACECAVGAFDVLGGCAALEVECFVVVLILHSGGCGDAAALVGTFSVANGVPDGLGLQFLFWGWFWEVVGAVVICTWFFVCRNGGLVRGCVLGLGVRAGLLLDSFIRKGYMIDC